MMIDIARFWSTMDRGFAPYFADPAHSLFYELTDNEDFSDRAAAECLVSVGDHAIING